MALEAELLYACTTRGMVWESALEMELWQIASALGLHRVETREKHDQREIVEKKEEYWDETWHLRAEKLANVSAERKARALERKRGRKREEVVGSN